MDQNDWKTSSTRKYEMIKANCSDQTSDLDMFTAWSLVDSATTKMKEQRKTFDNFHSKAL